MCMVYTCVCCSSVIVYMVYAVPCIPEHDLLKWLNGLILGGSLVMVCVGTRICVSVTGVCRCNCNGEQEI